MRTLFLAAIALVGTAAPASPPTLTEEDVAAPEVDLASVTELPEIPVNDEGEPIPYIPYVNPSTGETIGHLYVGKSSDKPSEATKLTIKQGAVLRGPVRPVPEKK